MGSRKRTNGAAKAKADPRLAGALELIEEQRQVLLAQVTELELAANRLAGSTGVEPPYPEPM